MASREVTTAQAWSCCWPEGFVCEAGGSGVRSQGKAMVCDGWAVAQPAGPEFLGGSTHYFDQMIGFA